MSTPSPSPDNGGRLTEGGSGDGGELGTPTSGGLDAPAGDGQDENMVVSGGGVATPSEDDTATAGGDRGLG